MSLRTISRRSALLVVIALAVCASAAVPHMIDIQGKLTDDMGAPVSDDVYFIQFRLYDLPEAGNELWSSSGYVEVPVEGGMFNYVLGASNPLPDSLVAFEAMWLGITVQGQAEMSPRIEVVSTAYALHAGHADFAGMAELGLNVPGNTINTDHIQDQSISFIDIGDNGAAPGQIMKWNGVEWFPGNDEAGGGESHWSVLDSVIFTNNPWGITRGNVENGVLGPGAPSMVNLGIACTTGVTGANVPHSTVGGGLLNKAVAAFSTVSGGEDNTSAGSYSAVGGGSSNTAGADYTTVGGGLENTVTGNHSVVGGGEKNVIRSNWSAILGGYADTIGPAANYSYLFGISTRLDEDSTFAVDLPHIRFGDHASGYEFPPVRGTNGQILTTDGLGKLSWTAPSGAADGDWLLVGDILYSGGRWGIARSGNTLYGPNDSTHVNLGVSSVTGKSGWSVSNATVGGGFENEASGYGSTVAGGFQNAASYDGATVAGGTGNEATASGSAVGGGGGNTAGGLNSVVAGGNANEANGRGSCVGGGIGNSAADSIATIAGGEYNSVYTTGATIGGGGHNSAHGYYSVVAGGGGPEYSDSNVALGDYSFVGGGKRNHALTKYAVIVGGTANEIYGEGGTISGGSGSYVYGWFGTIGGGVSNWVSDTMGTICGGVNNLTGAPWASIGGGSNNYADGQMSVIGGGEHNRTRGAYSVVGGGGGGIVADSNSALGDWSVVPGGRRNVAAGKYSFAAGRRAIASHDGCFVWADSIDTDFSSWIDNEFAIRAQNGFRVTSENIGMYAAEFNNSGSGDGIRAYTNSNSGNVYGALYAVSFGSSPAISAWEGSGLAGYFSGDVEVTGYLYKTGGGFKIDHPLDPGNKYLNHSFVESPDMKNVYDGNAVLDNNGEAWVDLPDYFEALNRDFRYQLTCVGGYAPVYIAEKISSNRFRIAGGTPGLEVSWQVTGIRQDAYADVNRIPVEVAKAPQDRGKYLHPEVFGQPVEKTVGLSEAGLAKRRQVKDAARD